MYQQLWPWPDPHGFMIGLRSSLCWHLWLNKNTAHPHWIQRDGSGRASIALTTRTPFAAFSTSAPFTASTSGTSVRKPATAGTTPDENHRLDSPARSLSGNYQVRH